MNNTEIGKNIRAYRKICKMTQQELADKLFVTQVTVQQWEKGKKIPQADKLTDIANIFNVKIDQLYYNDSEFRYFISDFEWAEQMNKQLRRSALEKKKNKIPLNQVEETAYKLHKLNIKKIVNDWKNDLYKRGKVVWNEPFISTEFCWYSFPITEYDFYMIRKYPQLTKYIQLRHIASKHNYNAWYKFI